VPHFVFRLAFFVLPLASIFISTAAFGQTSARNLEAPASSSAPSAAGAQPVSDEVAEAEAAIVSSDWKKAEARLAPWLVAHPTDARALFDAGYVASAENRPEDAAGFYRRAVEANPKSFEAHLELGLLLARQGKLAEARPELAAAATLDPGAAGVDAQARAWRALAQIDRATDLNRASEDLLEALKLSPETPEDTLLAASLAEQAGQYEAAEAAYRRILAQNANSTANSSAPPATNSTANSASANAINSASNSASANAAASAGLAHLLILRKQYPEAEALLRKALVQSPEDAALTVQLATVLAAQNKAEALPLMRKLHEAHPQEAAITRVLAEVLAQAGEAAASDKLYVSLLTASPDDPDLLVGHGQNLIHQLKFAAAFSAFDKATRLDPANAGGWSGLAFAASKTNQPSVTLHALEMRAKYLPEVPSTYFLRATAYDTLHQKTAAAACYHQFLTASAGKFPNQEWQARQRLLVLEGKK
jgi:tetratricopeptide (TPR) repeat protein